MQYRRYCLVCTLPLFFGNCVSYEAKPLALESYASKWRNLRLDEAGIDQYLTRLSRPSASSSQMQFTPDDGITLPEAEAIALFFNPQLRRLRAEARVPFATAQEAGWWPDPNFQASILGFANRGRPGGFGFEPRNTTGINTTGLESTPAGFRQKSGGEFVDNPLIVNVGLTLTLPLSGRLAVAEDFAWAEYDVAWRQVAVREWQLITELRSAWLQWSVTNERLQVSRDYAKRLEQVSDIASRLASVGELNTTDARVLAIELAQQLTNIQQIEIQRTQQRLALLSLLGLAPNTPFDLLPDLAFFEMVKAVAEQDRAILENHPQILAARADYEAAEQALRLEIRKQYPDLNIGPNYTLEEGFSRIGGSFGLSLPLWNRNRQAIAEATALRESTRVRAETTVQSAFAELALVRNNKTLATQRIDLISKTLVPLVNKQIAETQMLLDLGEVEVLVLREALRASFDTKIAILNATLDRNIAANQLRQMVAPIWIAKSASDAAEE